MSIGAMLILFLVLMLIGMPISFATAVASGCYVLFGTQLPDLIIAQRMFVASDSFSLMAIPLFILAGELMNGGGLTKRIVRLASALVGHIRGGMAHITILASMMFASMSGSSAAAAASIGSMMIPAMKEDNYDPDFAASVTACGAVIGPIIPPSIAMVMYGSITGESTGKLFLGGVVPGILLGLLLMMVSSIMAKKRGYKPNKRTTKKELWSAFRGSISAILMPVIIMGGILSGIFTATEAGVVAAVYSLLVGLFTHETRLRDIPRIVLNAARTSAVVMFIIAAAMLLGWVLTQAQVTTAMVNFASGLTDSPTVMFFLLLGLLFILGCFMIDAAIITLCTPLFIPILAQFGINPLHFGVVMCMMTTTGGVTPPVGNLLFIACGISDVPVVKAVKTLMPFLAMLIVAIIICTLCPPIVTLLPSLM